VGDDTPDTTQVAPRLTTMGGSRKRRTGGLLLKISGMAHCHAYNLDVDQRTALLAGCAKPWPNETAITLFYGSVRDTKTGDVVRIPWSELGKEMARNAAEVAPKGAGPWFVGGISMNGGCKDADIEQVTLLSFDCDGAGDWDGIVNLLDRSGIAYIACRSSSHTPERPKWHLHIPLADYWSGSKPDWRISYRHALAWFSAAAGLTSNLSDPTQIGFDISTDRLGQPWFWSARRTDDQAPPALICRNGLALDGERFEELTGLKNSLQAATLSTERPSTRPKQGRKPKAAECSAGANSVGLLELAFDLAGWLGPEFSGGKRAVRCPWSDQHTTGSVFDRSTVIFSGEAASGRGWFYCSHAHCRDREQYEVLRALPTAALRGAMMTRLTRRKINESDPR